MEKEEKVFREDKSTPFYDSSLTVDERINWLLANLTLEEKCSLIGSSMPDLPRLGIRGVGVGGEAAHGVQQRNDWYPNHPEPEPTTSFPQPIGMSASWDTERIEKAGEVTGIEARVIANRHGGQGLSRWAPTVDLERDPRWGRNEEGYGEDPHLTGEMAGSYILGMQGEPAGKSSNHLRCAATLKHFYANNVEEGRGYKNSTIDPRNREELYLETFKHVIRKGHPEGVMTAYNKINGVVGMFNPEVKDVLKEECGITHAVSDGSAPDLARSMQHRYGTDAEVVAAALKAGIDGLVNDRRTFEPAAIEALDLGLITKEDLDRAITNTMRTKLRLGVYDRVKVNPYDNVTEADLGSEANAGISLDMAHASLVLLKNDGILPLIVEKITNASNTDSVDAPAVDVGAGKHPLALIGPLGDRWDQDWYCGEPMYKSTLKAGLEKNLGSEIAFDDGLDRVALYVGDKPMRLRVQKKNADYSERDERCADDEIEGGIAGADAAGAGAVARSGKCAGDIIRLYAGNPGEEPEIFIYEEYGDNCVSLMSTTYGRYLVPLKPGYGEEGQGMPEESEGWLVLGPNVQFDWFATGALRLSRIEAVNRIVLRDRWGHKDEIQEDGFTMKVVSSGAERAKELAARSETVILALGSNPMIPAKEELDRRAMHLAGQQEKLLAAVTEANADAVLMLFANYPYILPETEHPVKAILMSATGSQDMGQAAADGLLGLYAPAGRLAQTWYKSEDDLPPNDDYDIIGGQRTYRYFPGEVEFPFGFGKTYTTFAYSDFSAEELKRRESDAAQPDEAQPNAAQSDAAQPDEAQPDEAQSNAAQPDVIRFTLKVTNIGSTTSDEVVQIYAQFPNCRVKRPIRQLVGFKRIHDVKPGETREVEIVTPETELEYYDVIAETKVLAGGSYKFTAGSSSAAEEQWCEAVLTLEGDAPMYRDPTAKTLADHYDEQIGVGILDGFHGRPAVCASSHDGLKAAEDREMELIYRDYLLSEGDKIPTAIKLLICADEDSRLDVFLRTVENEPANAANMVSGSVNGSFVRAAEWHGNTQVGMPGSASSADPQIQRELEAYFRTQPARYAYLTLPLDHKIGGGEAFDLKLAAEGDIRIVQFYFE